MHKMHKKMHIRLPILILILALPILGGCSAIGKLFDTKAPPKVDSVSKALAVAQGTYAGTVHLMVAAAKTGKLAPKLILKLDAVRKGARTALDLADKLIAVKDPEAAKYLALAIEEVAAFRAVFAAWRDAAKATGPPPVEPSPAPPTAGTRTEAAPPPPGRSAPRPRSTTASPSGRRPPR